MLQWVLWWCFFSEGRVKSLALTVREVSGAEGLVSDTISWIASLSLSLCSGLLMPISLWISVSDSADMMAPLFTLARQAATYHAGMPTHSCELGQRNIFVNAAIIIIVIIIIVITEQWSVFIISVILLSAITEIIIIPITAAWYEYVCAWDDLPQAKRPPSGHPTEQTEGLSSVHLPKARAWQTEEEKNWWFLEHIRLKKTNAGLPSVFLSVIILSPTRLSNDHFYLIINNNFQLIKAVTRYYYYNKSQ